MTKKIVRVESFPKIFKSYNKELKEKYVEMVEKSIIDFIPELVEKSPVDTGQYANSWRHEKHRDKIELGNHAPHAPIIEFGARPFKPPLKPLLEWAKRVLGDGSQPPDYSDDVWSLAVGTQRKIEKEGMRPRHIMRDAIDDLLENIKRRAEQMREARP